MANAATTKSALESNFKKILHDEIVKNIPEHVILSKGVGDKSALIKWAKGAKKTGDFYEVPTLLRGNQGVSYLGTEGLGGDLEDATAMVMKPAKIKAVEVINRGRMSYRAAAESVSSEQAFESAWGLLTSDLQKLAYTRLEIQALHGQEGLGAVETVGTAVGSTVDLTITAATFAPGMWPLLEGASLDSFTGTTKNNTGTIVVNSVDADNRKVNVTFSGTLASDITAGDVLYFKGANAGAGSFNEFCGLFKQLAAVSGTMFELDRTTYSVTRGNTVAVGGAITKAKVLAGLKKCHDRGATGKFIFLCSTESAITLQAAEDALRQYDSSYSKSKAVNGFEGIEYIHGPSSVTVLPHPMVKNGQAALFKPEEAFWVGATQPTFNLGGSGEEFFQYVADKAQFEIQNMTIMALYHTAPSHACVFSGIAN